MSNLKKKIDKGLTDFYLNLDVDVIKESFINNSVNIEEESQRISQFVKRLKFKHQALATKEKTDNLLEIIIVKFQSAIEKNIDKPIATIRRMIEEKELSVQFRNLDKLSEEEIKEIIKGKNLVDLMDELDGKID